MAVGGAGRRDPGRRPGVLRADRALGDRRPGTWRRPARGGRRHAGDDPLGLVSGARRREALRRLARPRAYVDAASAAAAYLPAILGASGQRSYLLLFPNPDELRPIGGFVGAVGTITFSAGTPAAVEIRGEEALDGRYGQ